MNKDSKNPLLQYGDAILIAKKCRTTPEYVRNILYLYRKGQSRFHGAKAKKIIRILGSNQT